MRKPIVVVGSVNVDFAVQAPRLPRAGETVSRARFLTFFGGKGANQAVAAARLGATTAMVAKVGDDAFGPRLRASLRAAGVDTRCVRAARGVPSGVAFVVTAPDGENQIVVAPGANATLSCADIRRARARLATAAAILVQLEVPPQPLAAVAELAARHHIPLILDPAPVRPLPASLLRRVSVLTPNQLEACLLAGERPRHLTLAAAHALCHRLLRRGPRAVVLKLGQRGAVVGERGRRAVTVPAVRVEPVDTTGAGDAFTAALGVALVEGATLVEAARYACAAAALSATRAGAQPSMPTRAAVAAFLRRHRIRRHP